MLTLDELNLDTAATLTLILAPTGQTIVLIRGGVDVSIGGVISLGTVVAATRFGDGAGSVLLWSALILAGGFRLGALNGLLITALGLQPFLVTLATWSILSGAALMVLPSGGGMVPGWWVSLGYREVLGLGLPAWMLLALLLFWGWFRSTRLGLSIQAAGSNERSAFLSGVSILRINLATYGLSGLFAAAAALFLTTQTSAGSPTIGRDYILPSVAAAVIGGVSLFGGRGHLLGTVVGAFILTLIGNLVFTLRLSSHWQPVTSGVILLVAVVVASLAETAARRMTRFLASHRAVLLAWAAKVVLLLATSLVSPGFLSGSNLRSTLILAAFAGIVAFGQTLVIIGGGIDLSIPWVLNSAAVLMALLCAGSDAALLWVIPLVLRGGGLIGLVNGLGVAVVGVPPIIMTLAANVILQGLLLVGTGGAPSPAAPAAIRTLATGRLGPVPIIALVWLTLAVLATLLMARTASGRHLYAVGPSPAVAELSGVPTRRTTTLTYVASGLTAALAGILLPGYTGQAYLGMGDPYLFTSVAAVAIGGASILGGGGSYLGTVAGALVLTILTGLLPALNLSSGALLVVYRAVIFVTVAVSGEGAQRLGRLRWRRSPGGSGG